MRYEYAKGVLEDPTIPDYTTCGDGLYVYTCPISLPTLEPIAIVQIALGGALVISGGAISMVSYSRYEPKQVPFVDNHTNEGAPFK